MTLRLLKEIQPSLPKPSLWGLSLYGMLSWNFFTRHLQFICLDEADPNPDFPSPGLTSLTGEITFLLSYKPALNSQSLLVGIWYSTYPSSVDWVYWTMLNDRAQVGFMFREGHCTCLSTSSSTSLFSAGIHPTPLSYSSVYVQV